MARFTAATAGMDPFEHYYVDARELEAARRRGDHRKIKELDSKPGTMAHVGRLCVDNEITMTDGRGVSSVYPMPEAVHRHDDYGV